MTLTSATAPSAFAPAPHLDAERSFSTRERFISYDEVYDRTGLSRTTIWRVRHQHSLDRIGGMRKGGFLAHRSHTRSADETEIRDTERVSEQVVKNIRRATRKHYSAEDKIRIVLDGLRGEYSIAELCRREGIAESLYYSWSKEFLEAGKRRLAGDTARAATTDEVKDLRREAQELKEVVAEQALELRLLKKSMIADGGDGE